MQTLNTVARSPSHDLSDSLDWKASILSKIDGFPVPASESRKLYFYLQGAHSALEGATELIGRDPLLAIEVIRASNSAVYGSRGASSLEDAVQAIGLERLGRIALRIWLKNLVPRELRVYQMDDGTFATRALACASAMRFIYQGDTYLSETAYAIGLLHSIGRVIIEEALRSGRDTELVFQQVTARRIAEAEFHEFGITHAEVGGFALKRWGFAKQVYGPISAQFSNSEDADPCQWTQSLAISRFIADRALEALGGLPDSMRGEGRAIYRGKPLMDIFEYTMGMLDQDSAPSLN